MSPRDTLRSAAPSRLAERVGGEMDGRSARVLSGLLYQRGIAAVASKLGDHWIVRVPPEQARRAEPIAFGFRAGTRVAGGTR